MKLLQLSAFLMAIMLSHGASACVTVVDAADDGSTRTRVKVGDVVSVSVGENVKSSTQIGTADSNDKAQQTEIKIDTILHKAIGNNVTSCLQWPDGDEQCE